MDYVAGVWGFKTFPKLQTIQNKAIRHVMGVGKNCPVDLLEGNSGWVPVPCLRCLNYGIALLQWMIVGLPKRFLSGL